MKIVDSYARLIPPPHVDISMGWTPFEKEHGIQLLRRVEWYARISHRTEEAQTADSYDNFLRRWVNEHGDYSTIEHCTISADVLVDRGLSHELVRHRIAKIADQDFDIDVSAPEVTQESTRFVNYGKRGGDISVILPPELVKIHHKVCEISKNQGLLAAIDLIDPKDEEPLEINDAHRLLGWYNDWLQGVEEAEKHYLYQIRVKVAPELARDMLPHCTATRMVMTHNLRNWRHLLLMRSTNETHRKLRPLMVSVLEELQEKVPILYDDLEPNQKQSANLRKGR
jgi:thymidylate synthase (FAD)